MKHPILYTCHHFNGQLDDYFGVVPFQSDPVPIIAHSQEAIVDFLKNEEGYIEIDREYFNNGDGLKIEFERYYNHFEKPFKSVFAIVRAQVIDEIIEPL